MDSKEITISGVTNVSLDSSGTSLVTQGYSSGGTKIFDFRKQMDQVLIGFKEGTRSHTGSLLALSPLET